MNATLPKDVAVIVETLTKAGFKAYIVGGAVRDLLVNPTVEPSDWDFTTNATPEEILALFPEAFYENEFGTVAISREHVREQFNLPHTADNNTPTDKKKTIDLETATKIHESLKPVISTSLKALQSRRPDEVEGSLSPSKGALKAISPHQPAGRDDGKIKHVFEITTFRSDGAYSDFRKPDSVTWGKTIEEDLQRRDFTINAMAISIPFSHLGGEHLITPEVGRIREGLTTSLTLIDPHGGQQDLQVRVIRTVGDPEQRFQEDALRMLRAIRFSVQLEFELAPNLLTAIQKNAKLIRHISWERIRDEFLKMIATAHPKKAIELLDTTELLPHILPELIQAKGVQQGGHHVSDVWTHSLNALSSCPSLDPIVRLATLLHDIAKPTTFRIVDNKITFYNHEIIGARMARAIALRMKLSKHDVEKIFTLVRHHMFYYQPENTDAAIRRFMRKVGLENINDIIDLRIGDRLGSGSRETSWRFEEMKKRMQDQLNQPFSVTDLAIDGHDLMNELNIQPSPLLGKILNALFEEVLEKPELNTKERLLQRSQEIQKSGVD